MNVSSLIRGLIGENKLGDGKKLELREGQVVRGVVMSVSEDGQEAVVQIQGVKVNAKLETPLQQGQATLLQVQTAGEGGEMVLKPLSESPYTPLSLKTLASVLDGLGLPDTKDNRQLLQTLQASGIPLTKENVALFQNMLTSKLPAIPAEQWLQSAAIAFQRGLPMTPESVKGLQQAIFGQPIHQLLSSLGEQAGVLASQMRGAEGSAASSPNAAIAATGGQSGTAAAVVGNGAAAGQAAAGGAAASGSSSEVLALLTKLQGVLSQLREVPAAGGNVPTASPSGDGGAAAPAQAAASQAAATNGGAAKGAGEALAGASPQPPVTHAAEPWVGRLLKLLGAEHEQQAARRVAFAPQESAATQSARPEGPAPAAQPGATPLAQDAASGRTAQGQPAQNALPGQNTAAAAGASAAQQTTAAAVMPNAANAAVQGSSAALAAAAAEQPTFAASSALQALAGDDLIQQDTLKGILLQLMKSDDIPPIFKETAQQIVSHLTGQQLLLNTDRTAPFALVTMFIPFVGPDGQETASVQIQSKRGRKGELDASNCHLWFDLQMKHLGPTLLDVQVVDRMVSLNVYNDQDWTVELLEAGKESIAQAMESVGYQLITLNTKHLPDTYISDLNLSSANVASDYVPDPYKGVDIRI